MTPLRRRQNPFSRRAMAGPAAGTTMLIVTEGEKTEPVYLNDLRIRLKLQSVAIHIVNAAGTDALSVVNDAIAIRDEQKGKARRGNGVPYDSVWAVFDTERAAVNPRLNDALRKAAARKIKVALSNPCFEYWLLLHYEYTTATFAKCENVVRRLKDQGHIPEYAKGEPPMAALIPRIGTAVANAERCRADHARTGTDNPSTRVDLLVREMNGATRPHCRLQL